MTCSVVLFYTRQPGHGALLMRDFARWVKARPGIKMAIFSLEHNADPRIETFLRRLGFGYKQPQMTYVREL